MNNQEKAKEIAKRDYRHYYGFYAEYDSQEECEESALEMAEWKDQQFKEYLEKKMLTASFVTALNTKKDIRRKEIETSVYYNIINELFKED